MEYTKNYIDLRLLKWFSLLFDVHNGDYYFPFNLLDRDIKRYNQEENSDIIKQGIINIQKKLLADNVDSKSLNINKYFKEEFNMFVIKKP